jgi:hypothetical protein
MAAPRGPRPLKLYGGLNAHLIVVAERDVPAACVVCRRGFAADELVPACERCGARSTHFGCEPAFSTDVPAYGAFLCAGCRS